MANITKRELKTDLTNNEPLELFKKKIQEEYNRLIKKVHNYSGIVEFQREICELALASAFAKEEININLDIKTSLEKVITSYNGCLNSESLSDLGVAIASYFPEKDYSWCFKRRDTQYCREIKPLSVDYGMLFKIIYASQIRNQNIDLSQNQKERVLQHRKTALEEIALWVKQRYLDDNTVFELKPLLIGQLVICKEFKNFRVPKNILDLIYSRISQFKPKYDTTERRIFTEKVLLSCLDKYNRK